MKLAIVTAVILLFFGIIYFLLPSLTDCGEPAKATFCGHNMAEIGKALQAYATKHRGEPPPTLEVLVSENFVNPKSLICPFTKDNHRYFYLGLPMDEKDSETVVVFEPITLHGDLLVGNALFADGAIRWLNDDKLQAALLKTTTKLRNGK
jgi:hypothetical protein